MAVKTSKPAATTTNKPSAAPAHKADKVNRDAVTNRPIMFPVLTVCGIEIPAENLEVSADDAKTLLGWESESEHETRLTKDVSPEVASKLNVKYGSDYDLTDYNGEKVKLRNNLHNRPVDMRWLKQLAYDILNKFWRFNGESWVVGKTGLTLSLQHRALGLIWANQIIGYSGEDEEKLAEAKRWQKVYPDGVTVQAVVVRGVEETADVTRTLDNVRPRSLSDVLFADTSMFKQTAKADREKLCKLTDIAIRTVQKRTGEDENAFDPRRSHSASLEFLSRHPRLVKAVSFLFTETNKKNDNGEKAGVLHNYIGAGTAAGLMFLMGSSTSDRERWDEADTPNDRHLDFSRWEDAEAFFAGLNDPKNQDFEGVRKAIKSLGNAQTGQKPPVPVVVAVLVNAWNEFVDENGSMTTKNVMPEFGPMDDYGNRPLVGTPSVGGIDLGDAKAVRKQQEKEEAEAAAAEQAAEEAALEDGGDGDEGDNSPSEEEQAEIAARAAAEKQRSLNKKGGLRGGTGK